MSSSTFSGPVTSNNGFVGDVTGDLTGAVLASTPVAVTSATVTITQADHAGRVVTLSRAGGITATLPAATGSGSVYKFVVRTTFTGSGIVKVANTADTMQGMAYLQTDNTAAVVAFTASSGDDTITLNGTTTGGYAGAWVEVTDVAANVFHVKVFSPATSNEATPFSATV